MAAQGADGKRPMPPQLARQMIPYRSALTLGVLYADWPASVQSRPGQSQALRIVWSLTLPLLLRLYPFLSFRLHFQLVGRC